MVSKYTRGLYCGLETIFIPLPPPQKKIFCPSLVTFQFFILHTLLAFILPGVYVWKIPPFQGEGISANSLWEKKYEKGEEENVKEKVRGTKK